MTTQTLAPAFVKETSTTAGTGTYTLAGAMTGFRTFAQSVDVGDCVPYVAIDKATGYFEAGIGRLATSTTLERVWIAETWNGTDANMVGKNAVTSIGALNWAAGTREIYVSSHAGATLPGRIQFDPSENYAPTNAGANDGASAGSIRGGYLGLGRNGTQEYFGHIGVSVSIDRNSGVPSFPIKGGAGYAYDFTGLAWRFNSYGYSCYWNASDIDAAAGITGFGAWQPRATAGAAYTAFAQGDSPNLQHNVSRVFGYGYGSGTDTHGQGQDERIGILDETTNATPKAIYPWQDNTSTVSMPVNSVWFVRARVVAREMATGDIRVWNVEFVMKRGAGAPSLAGSVTKTSVFNDTGAATWDIGVTADATDNGPRFTATGEAAKTIRWVVDVDVVQNCTGL